MDCERYFNNDERRRGMMLKKLMIMILVLSTTMMLSSCRQKVEDEKADSKQIHISEDTSILIAYFSWSGHTQEVAQEINRQVGGDLFEIVPQEPYTDDINVLSKQSLQEQRDQMRPALSTHVDNMDQYDVVFLGYPNWWSNMPMPVFTFLEEYDFSHKTIIAFTTYGESGFGHSIDSINDILTHSHVVEGIAIQEHDLDKVQDHVKAFLDNDQ